MSREATNSFFVIIPALISKQLRLGLWERQMAEVWLWRDGNDPTTGEPLAELGLADCVEKLQVGPDHYCAALSAPPRFETSESPPARGVRVVMGSVNLRGYRHVVLRVDEAEAAAQGWAPGFYRCPVSPEEAHELLFRDQTGGEIPRRVSKIDNRNPP
jgi:hypothetical protein